MKKYYLIILFAATALTGCVKKVDELFSETPDQRLQKALTAYRTALIQSPGWKLFVYPQGLQSEGVEVGGLTYYVNFPDSNRVRMVSDFRVETALTPKESGYRVRADQRPSLVFDTYSYIHLAADPDPGVSQSPAQTPGFGWGTDFDFSFTTAEPRQDTLFLEGNFNHSPAIMLPATQEEMDAAFNGGLAHIVEATKTFTTANPFQYFRAADNSQVEVSFNLFLFRINFNTLNGNAMQTVSAAFSHTTYGVHFKNPITVGGYTFQDMYWDDALDTYYIQTGSGRVNISPSTAPVIPFNVVLGRSVTSIVVPTTPLDGQSAAFDSVYATIRDNLKNGNFGLELHEMYFTFDAPSNSMVLDIIVEQDRLFFLVEFVYSYTISSSNVANFTRVGQNQNASLVETDLAPLTDRIDDDTFVLDYFTGVAPPLGQFSSQDHPEFSFTGNLQ